jgi:hypothetical protein
LRNGETLNFQSQERDVILLNLLHFHSTKVLNFIRLDSTIQGKNRPFNVEYADYLLKQISSSSTDMDNLILDLNQMIIPTEYQCKEKNLMKVLFEKYAKDKKNMNLFLLVDMIRSKGIFEDVQYFSKSFHSIMFEDDLTFEFHVFTL